MKGRTEMLLRTLARKFGVVVPEELAERIRGTTDPILLEQWLDLVFATSSFEDFQQRM